MSQEPTARDATGVWGHRDSFEVQQKLTVTVNRYRVLEPAHNSGSGRLIAFAEQKPFKLKEEVVFFADESKTQPLFSFQARKKLDTSGGIDVFDAEHRRIGSFSKAFKRSLWRSTWKLDAPGLSATGQERRPAVAVARRLWGFIPGLENAPAPFRFHFDFYDDATGEPVFVSRKLGALKDRYDISVPDPRIEFPLAASLAVALDALQSR